MINVTGLWENKDKNGNVYLAGNIGGVRVMIFKNADKRTENSPDWRLVFAENKPQGQDNQSSYSKAEEELKGEKVLGGDENSDVPF